MLTIAILEDDPSQLRELLAAVRGVTQADGTPCSVVPFSSGDAIVESESVGFDIYLLDIQMQGRSGLDVARFVRERNERALIVFITASASYAIEGYSVQAFDYVLKPFDEKSLARKLRRTIACVRGRERRFLDVGSKTCAQVCVDSIAYLETAKRRTVVHLRDGAEHQSYKSLAAMQKELPSDLFFRCHAAFVVNVACVTRVQQAELTVCGDAVPLARGRRHAFLEFLAAYLGGAS